jgi:thioredoxin-like negative regulator of GroEL
VAPVLDQIVEERSDLRLVKVNIDEEPEVRAPLRRHEHPDR